MAPLRGSREYLQALLDVEVALAPQRRRSGVIPAVVCAGISGPPLAQTALMRGAGTAAARGRQHRHSARPRVDRGGRAGNPSRHATFTAAPPVRTSWTRRSSCSCVPPRPVGEDLTRAMPPTAWRASHAATPMPGRTWLQHASPTTFGVKAAGWLDMLGRCANGSTESVDRAQVVQLGGAAGTLASLGERRSGGH